MKNIIIKDTIDPNILSMPFIYNDSEKNIINTITDIGEKNIYSALKYCATTNEIKLARPEMIAIK
ncbi:MAG: hypothetical protein ACEPOW_03845 [Bacteroidales bacterium]